MHCVVDPVGCRRRCETRHSSCELWLLQQRLNVSNPVDTTETIQERSKTHGPFPHVCSVAQALKREMQRAPGWEALNASQKEGLEMVAHKMARILVGDPNEPDHWHDIAGYATLNHNLLTKGTHL